MWLEIIEGTILLGAFIYHRWTEDSSPPTPGEQIAIPAFVDGSPIPLLYGTCRVRAPVLIWAGNQVLPENGIGNYSIDMTFVVGLAFYGGGAKFAGLWAGDVEIPAFAFAWVQDPDPSGNRQQIFAHNDTPTGGIGGGGRGAGEFFGGGQQNAGFGPGSVGFGDPATGGGGVNGGTGGSGETLTAFSMRAAGIDGTLIPGYRDQVIITLGGGGGVPGGGGATIGQPFVIGQSASLPGLSFSVTALSTGSMADLGRSLPLDADPAAVIIDLLTSPWGKLGMPPSLIDMPSFNAASATLFAEGHGYSRAVESTGDASSIIIDVLQQIDAAFYPEPTTGKFVIKLIRNDFDVNALDDINPDNATPSGDNWYSIQGWSEMPNQVRVTFTDSEDNFIDATVTGQNTANAVAQGRPPRVTSKRFVGCRDRDLARRLTSRELAVVSRPMAKVSVVTSRAFASKRPGDAVTWTWPELGVNRMVMRVARVDLGEMHAPGVTLDLIRDTFDVSIGAFPVP